MPSHGRRQILDALRSLAGGLTQVGAIFEDRTIPIPHPRQADDSKIPCTVIEPAAEPVEREGESQDDGSVLETRRLRVIWSCLAGTRAAADAMALEAEKAIAASSIGSSRRVLETGFDAAGAGSGRVFSAQIALEVEWRALNTTPDVMK